MANMYRCNEKGDNKPYMYVNDARVSGSDNIFNLYRYIMNDDCSLTLDGAQGWYGDPTIEGSALYLDYVYPTFSLKLKAGHSCMMNGQKYTATSSDLTLVTSTVGSMRNYKVTIMAYE